MVLQVGLCILVKKTNNPRLKCLLMLSQIYYREIDKQIKSSDNLQRAV